MHITGNWVEALEVRQWIKKKRREFVCLVFGQSCVCLSFPTSSLSFSPFLSLPLPLSVSFVRHSFSLHSLLVLTWSYESISTYRSLSFDLLGGGLLVPWPGREAFSCSTSVLSNIILKRNKMAASTPTRSIVMMEGNLDRKESGASLSCSLLRRCTFYSTWLWHRYKCAQVGRKVAFPIWFVSLPLRTQRDFKSKNDESLLFSIRD